MPNEILLETRKGWSDLLGDVIILIQGSMGVTTRIDG